jgi:hypothetical protein
MRRAEPEHGSDTNASIGQMPVGPWLLVIGMHRSGTSAVAGALGKLGFAVPVEEDRWEPSSDNPDHWESRALALYSDLLLERIGGTWDRPPDSHLGVEIFEDLDGELGDPSLPASRAFPEPGAVLWKDPRTCLLLPYWRAHLPGPVAAVFIWRQPLAVARSLRARDRMHLADGVALWERYNRCAIEGLSGIDTFVIRYEEIVDNPTEQLGAIAKWLAGLPQFAELAPGWDLSTAVGSISTNLQRQQSSEGVDDLLLPEQQELVRFLDTLAGPHRPFLASLDSVESVWTEAILRDRQQLTVLSRQREELRETARRLWFDANGANAQIDRLRTDIDVVQDQLADMIEQYEQMQASTSWRLTRPIRRLAARRPGGRS